MKAICIISALVALSIQSRADATWQILSDYGLLASIHTSNTQLDNKKWKHTEIITPWNNIAVRTWCNGKELGCCLTDADKIVINSVDDTQEGKWEWIFQIDVLGEPCVVPIRARQQ
jgi:hypothetical protein